MWQGPSTRSLLVQVQTVTKPHPHTENRAWYPLFAQAFSFPLDYHVISILDVTKPMLLLYSLCSFSWLVLEIDFWVRLHTLLCPSVVRYPSICLQLQQVTSIMAVHKGNNIYNICHIVKHMDRYKSRSTSSRQFDGFLVIVICLSHFVLV